MGCVIHSYMKRKTGILTGCLLMLGLVLHAQVKKDTAAARKDSTAAKKTSYEELVKNPQKVVKGLMNLYYTKNKLYLEVPVKLLEKPMLLASTISEISDNFDGLVGSKPQQPIQVMFSRVDSSLLLRKIDQPIIAPAADSNLQRALQKNSMGAILKLFPVSAYNVDRSAAVIDVTEYFAGDIKELSPFGAFSMYSAQGLRGTQSFKRDRSFISDIKSFDDNVTIKSYLSYENTLSDGKRTYGKDRPFTVVMTRSLLLLAEVPARPRVADSRVGIFTTGKNQLSNEADRTEQVFFANRWNLIPKDQEAYKQGKLVEPVQPVVFYVDSDFPATWKHTVKEAIMDWNIAFEAAGFKNAVVALDYPENDPAFDPDNLKYNCVRYAPVPIGNAIGPSWVDPRTGEIINASVYVFHDVIKLLNNWIFIQTSPADTSVRHPLLPEARQQAGLKYVVRHEIGHCLGFMHNMGASSAIPVDSLRSPSFTQLHGTTYSIMDYARFNYVAQPGDLEKGVQLSPPLFGLYDYFMVKWNYSYFDSTVSDREQKNRLAAMVAAKAGDKRYRYGAQQGGILDPSSQTEDLGDDAVKASRYGINNLKYIMKNLNTWMKGQDKDYSYRQSVWEGVLSQYVRYINHVYSNVGGIYLNEKYVGDPRPFYESVPRKKQVEAMQFMIDELLHLEWIEDKSVLENMTLAGTPVAILRTQIVEALMEAPLKVNLAALKSKEQHPFTSDEAMAFIFKAVWASTMNGKRLSASEKEMQKVFVKSGIKNAKLIVPGAPGAFALTGGQPAGICLPWEVTGWDHCGVAYDYSPVSGFGGGRINFNAQPALESAYFNQLTEAKRLLEKSAAKTADKETQMHYRLLLNQINKALK